MYFIITQHINTILNVLAKLMLWLDKSNVGANALHYS